MSHPQSKVLIIGNGEIRWQPETAGFTDIVVFNVPRPSWVIGQVTQHWCVRRTDIHSPTFAGELLLPTHTGAPVFVDVPNEYSNQMVERYKYRGAFQVSPLEVVSTVGYKNGIPSTGFISIVWFANQGYLVDICGFQFSGWEGHNWELEKQVCQQLRKLGILKILQQ